ncbi:PPE family protein [Mycobacterium haemophilum]|uniref:PPE family protein n=1 Tax=Mycobacterium haemophilum TaxID=29311 RepID=UPI00069BC0F4
MAYFAAQSPEVNAASLLGGPGTVSLLAGYTAWREVYFGLCEAKHAFDDALRPLEWIGPAAMQMTQAASCYSMWLSDTKDLVDETATAMRRIASACDAARLKIVAPDRIAENRAELQELTKTNMLEQNRAAIAVKEAEYEEYRVRNAEAMFQYANAATAAMSQVLPFEEGYEPSAHLGATDNATCCNPHHLLADAETNRPRAQQR